MHPRQQSERVGMGAKNAAEAYRAARERLDEKLNQINHLVRAHAARQSKTPESRAHAGDINHVVEIFNEALEFLGGTKEQTKG